MRGVKGGIGRYRHSGKGTNENGDERGGALGSVGLSRAGPEYQTLDASATVCLYLVQCSRSRHTTIVSGPRKDTRAPYLLSNGPDAHVLPSLDLKYVYSRCL